MTIAQKIIGAVVIMLIAFFILNTYIYTEKQVETPSTTFSTYANNTLGFLFSYKTGDDGYILTEPEVGDSNDSLQKILVLTDTEDALRMEAEPIPSEGPPTITVLVFDNSARQFPLTWALEQELYSNINLKIEEPKEVVIGGANGITYTADGLYASEIVIVAHGSRMYVFNGGYMDASAPIRKDFQAILDSVTFIPEAGQQ